MIPEKQQDPTCLIVGNYCHDVLIKDDAVVAESLGGAVSFISAVLDGLSVTSTKYVAKVGHDFAYPVTHPPVTISTSETTLFHAYFSSEMDRVLKRVRTCDPILHSDLELELGPAKFDLGMAVGVAGEILPGTLAKMMDMCRLVLVDIQALNRVFDGPDGRVRQVELKETEFFKLLPRIGVLKASAEEAPYVDVAEARKWCCVVVTNGKDGCTVYWKDGEQHIAPFPTIQVDPTGAGDSFLGGFVAGLVHGLTVPDAALMGNFFGSLTVSQLGVPKFDSRILQRVKDKLQRRRSQFPGCHKGQESNILKFAKPLDHEQFHIALSAAKVVSTNSTEQGFCCLSSSDNHHNVHPKVMLHHEEPIKSSDSC